MHSNFSRENGLENLIDSTLRDQSNTDPRAENIMMYERKYGNTSSPLPERMGDAPDMGQGAATSKVGGGCETIEIQGENYGKEEITAAVVELRRRNEEMERIKMVNRLNRMTGNKLPTNVESCDINHLRKLCMEHKAIRASDTTVKLLKRMLLFTCKIAEEVSSKVDTEQTYVDLRGWSQSMEIEIKNYEENLHDIYDFYLTSFTDNPLITLAMSIGFSAASHSMERRMYKMMEKLERMIPEETIIPSPRVIHRITSPSAREKSKKKRRSSRANDQDEDTLNISVIKEEGATLDVPDEDNVSSISIRTSDHK